MCLNNKVRIERQRSEASIEVLTQEELSPIGLPLDVARDKDEVEDEEGARHERHHHDDSQGNVALDLPLLGVDGTS